MKIVVLDGYTLNPGDLSWAALEKLGEVRVHDRSAGPEIGERLKDADIALTNKTIVDRQTILGAPNLKYIGVIATGYNIVDIKAAHEKGVMVTNVPGYGTPSVVQMVFALLLELCLHVQAHSTVVHEGKWSKSKDFSFWDYPLVELQGKTMGILGFGDIGSKVADVATAFGMKVIAHSRTQSDQSGRKNFEWVSWEDLLVRADVISVHCPLTKETDGIFDKEAFKKMKPAAFLINTARGPVINEEDLAAALNKDIIAGAGLDVLSAEPPPADHALFSAKNCLITPHIAWATKESRQRLMDAVVSNLEAFMDHREQNVITI